MMEKREKVSKIICFIFLIFFCFICLQFLSPAILRSNQIPDLSGSTIFEDNTEITKDLPFPINILYSYGDRICHQKQERSFFINGNQMPFCSRCTAIWFGIPIGLFLLVFYTIELNEKILGMIIISILPLAIDGIGQLIGLWESTNILRVITGLPVGIASGIAIGIICDECSDIIKRKRLIKD